MNQNLKSYLNKSVEIAFMFLLFFSFFILGPFANKSFAQGYKSIGFFDMSKPVYQTHLSVNQSAQSDTKIPLGLTQITIKKGSFAQDVDVYVYQGDWNLLTKGPNATSSPISTYYLVFLSSQSKELQPAKPLSITIYDLYFSGTTATFTPIAKDIGTVDVSEVQFFPNQPVVQATLPITDGGYILAINKVVDRNSVLQNQTGNQPINVPSQTSNTNSKSPGVMSFVSQNILIILLIIVIIICVAGFIITVSVNKSGRQNT